jgi:amino acid adenylation domain-containing protein
MSACIHHRFAEQARRCPDRVGLVYGETHVTYGDIARRSRELASRLWHRGLAIEGRVAILLPRTPDLVISILAVLEAGGAYVPIDPSVPPQRLDYLLADSAPQLILTISELAGRLGGQSAKTILLDEVDARDGDAGAGARVDAPRPEILVADNLAYLLYTSGTTGAPKGVLVSHGNVTRLFDAFRQCHPIEDDEVWSLIHSQSFDFSVWEMWGALLHGGCVVLVPEATVREPAELSSLLLERQAGVVSVTPPVFYQLIAVLAKRRGAGRGNIGTLVFGGDKLNFSALDGLDAFASKRSIAAINMYGITETTVHVTFRLLDRDDARETGKSLVGRALPDMQVDLVGPGCGTVAVGQPGEILVSGAGLSRGYWGRPAETAARFVPHPRGGHGARAYKSGDIGRMHPDGDLEYLGRADDQVKVHGHRIELSEIAGRVFAHRAIDDVAVCVHGEDAQRQIVAYYVSADAGITTDELRAFAAEFLPAYMVPHVFVRMDRIPLNENGKVDKRRLAPPSGERPRTGVERMGPDNETERALIDIWERTLGVSGIGVDDNFFILGGDSIKSIQVVAAAQAAGVGLSVAAVFEHGTIRRLAESLGEAATRRPAGRIEAPEPFSLLPPSAVHALPGGLVDAFPASLMQQSLIFQSGFNDDYEIYVTSLRLRARFSAVLFEEAVRRQTEINEYLRMSLMFPEDGAPIQLVHRSTSPSLTIEDWRHVHQPAADQRMEEWLAAEKKTSFDWCRAPHVRFHVHLLTEDVFQLTISDASLDGWAVATLVTELLTDYARLLSNVRAPLPPVATRYAEFAALEKAILADQEAQEFWRSQIGEGLSYGLARRPDSGPKTCKRQRAKLLLGTDLTRRLRAFSQELEVPLRSVLLAAHVDALRQVSGGDCVVTGLELSGRPEGKDGDRIIGSFNNIVPCKLSTGHRTWRELVLEVLEQERRIMPYRRYPYAQLRRANGKRPLFDTVFVYTDFYLYDSLTSLKEFEVLGMDASDHTYFPLTIHFNMDSARSVINLVADYSMDEFSAEQVESILDSHVRSLEAT